MYPTPTGGGAGFPSQLLRPPGRDQDCARLYTNSPSQDQGHTGHCIDPQADIRQVPGTVRTPSAETGAAPSVVHSLQAATGPCHIRHLCISPAPGTAQTPLFGASCYHICPCRHWWHPQLLAVPCPCAQTAPPPLASWPPQTRFQGRQGGQVAQMPVREREMFNPYHRGPQEALARIRASFQAPRRGRSCLGFWGMREEAAPLGTHLHLHLVALGLLLVLQVQLIPLGRYQPFSLVAGCWCGWDGEEAVS